MGDELITVEQLRDYLGVDGDCDGVISIARQSAIARINMLMGADWQNRIDKSAVNEIVQIMVYLNYYGIRDESKNTEFLTEYLSQLLCSLQLTEGIKDGEGQKNPDI